MRPYTIFLHTEEAEIPSFRLAICKDDAEAREKTMKELAFSQAALSAELVFEGETIFATRKRQ